VNVKIRKSIPVKELPQYMEQWREKAPGLVHIEVIGESGSYPILAAFFTDDSYPDEEKEIALITAQHSGMEITGMTTVLSLGNYLASGAKDAIEILQKQIVVLVPCSNPYSYAQQSVDYQFTNEFGIDEYVAIDSEGVSEPEKAPAATAIQALIDKLQPELLLDFHGVWGEHQTTAETLGYSAFVMNRMYDRRFCDVVQQAAEEKGYGVFSEDLIQKLIPIGGLYKKSGYRQRFRQGRERGVSTTYSYLQYHTLSATAEVSFEESGFLRALRALQLGCGGYPVNTIVSPIGHHMVCAGGTTAAMRRENRIRLWQNVDKISAALVHPELIGVAGLLVTTSKSKINRIFSEREVGLPVKTLLDVLKEECFIEISGFFEFFEEHPNQHVALDVLQETEQTTSMAGMCLRIVIPFRDAIPKKVLLNGRALTSQEYTTEIIDNLFCVDIVLAQDYAFDIAFAVFDYDCIPPQEGILEF